MFKPKAKEIVAIDIGTSSVKLVQIKDQKDALILQKIGIMPLPAEAIVDNTLMDSSSVAEAIANLLDNLEVTAKEAACSISGNSVIIRKIFLPTMQTEELEEQIRWEAEQYIPFDINDVNIDFQILGPDENDPSRMSVLLVASKKDIVNDYLAVFNEAGIRVSVVDVDSFAMQNAFEVNYSVEPDEVSALINIGASMMNLNVVKNGISLFTRDVQMGGNIYTEEIQKQFGFGSEEAERLKIVGHGADDAKLQETISRVNESLALEIRRSLDFYNSTAGDGRIAKVYLGGGVARVATLPESISEKLNIPVEVINPLSNIKVSEKEFDADFLNEIAPMMTVAVGLATRRPGDK